MDINYSEEIEKIWQQTLIKLSHDLVNKLATIRIKHSFLFDILPELQKSYHLAVEHKLTEDSISKADFEYISEAMNVEPEVLSMIQLLDKLNDFAEELLNHQKISAQTCVKGVINSYPFQNKEKDSLVLTVENDFDIEISPLFIESPIKQFLYFCFNKTKVEARSNILISLSKEGGFHSIRCKLESSDLKASDCNSLCDQYLNTYLEEVLPGIPFCRLAFFGIQQGSLEVEIYECQSFELKMKFFFPNHRKN